MWFEQLTGFIEGSYENVSNQLQIEGDSFISKANGRKMCFGKLDIPTLESLREGEPVLQSYNDCIRVNEIVADVRALHCDPLNEHALFQAASQFNLLEMVDPYVTPEAGINRYEDDYTQGPACAIACGAGTIYRNYFVPIGDQQGQTRIHQVDCLSLIGSELNNEGGKLWKMRNGYAMASEEGLLEINALIAVMDVAQRERLKGKLKVGIQWQTEVTVSSSRHKVSQIYCSALPVAYQSIPFYYWESFARIILEATYEATLYAAVKNFKTHGSNKVFLTLVGGGAFGNESHWILESLDMALDKFQNAPLDVRVVSYGQSNVNLANALKRFN